MTIETLDPVFLYTVDNCNQNAKAMRNTNIQAKKYLAINATIGVFGRKNITKPLDEITNTRRLSKLTHGCK